MISRIYFLKPLSVFLFSSFIFACGVDDAGTPPNTQTPTSLISVHPQGGEYTQGSTAALSVTARAGEGALTYQWYNNTANNNNGGEAITGATSPTYTLPTGTQGTFYYYVVVSGSAVSAISNVAVVNVVPVRYIPIYNAVDLYNIRYNLSANYRLMNDISLSDYNIGSGWEPMGRCAVNADVPFSGSLDGNGYKITGLYIKTTAGVAGIFGCLTGKVDNLWVEIAVGGVTLSSSSSSRSYAGGIAGYVDGGTITGSYSTGYVSSTNTYAVSSNYSYAGGIAGYLDGGTIMNSYSTGYVSSSSSVATESSSYAGGIAGYVSGTISGSYSTGDIFSSSASAAASYVSYAGGIAGYLDGGTISESYSTGGIYSYSSSSSYAGGITGYASGTISGSYSTGGIYSYSSSTAYSSTSYAYAGGITGYISGTINGSYSTGDISSISSYSGNLSAYSSYSYAGGIAGYIDGIAITGCYTTGDISSASTSPSYSSSSSYAGGITGYVNNGGITNCAANGYIDSSAGGSIYAGRIIGGSISSSPATNNFANLNMLVNSAPVSDSTNNGTGKTLAELQTQTTYESAVNGDGLGGLGWEFGNSGGTPVWKMPEGGTGYPILY